MFERFSDRARSVIVLAQECARALDHDHVGTEHLLLGLIREEDGIAALALEGAGISFIDVQERVASATDRDRGAQHDDQAPDQSGHVPFDPAAKSALELSFREALDLNQSFVGTEHILLGLLREDRGVAAQVLGDMGLDLSDLRKRVLQDVKTYLDPAVDTEGRAPSIVLDEFGINLTRAIHQNRLDPVVGREAEVDRVMQVLLRRTKSNPVLVAEPGIDTASVVESLAQAMIRGDGPRTFDHVQVYRVDLASRVDHSADHPQSEKENWLSKVLAELQIRPDIICFFDQIHLAFSLEAPSEVRLAAPRFKELLASGTLSVVGATTSDEFRTYLAKDDTLDRLFQPIEVAEMSIAHTIDTLRDLRERYEAHHRVTIMDEALVAAATLAERYVSDRFLPESAVDLIDEASSRVRVRRMTSSPDLRNLDEKVAAARSAKEDAIDAQNFERAGELREEERELLKKRAELEAEWRSRGRDVVAEVDEDAIISVVADLTGLDASLIRLPRREAMRDRAGNSHPPHEQDTPFVLLGDHPVSDDADDLLGSAEIASKVASILVHSATSSPFVMAIEGSWGVGKSTLLRQIEKHLPPQPKSRLKFRRTRTQSSAERSKPGAAPVLVPVRFNAWTAQGDGALEGLIKSVLINLDANVVRRGITQLARRRRLVWVVRLAIGIFAHFLGVGRLVDRVWARLDADPQARNELRDFIGGVLSDWVSQDGVRSPNRALVVFIDDLDRCSEDIVVQVCEAVKLYLDAPGLIFVIACDLSVLTRSVSTSTRLDHELARTYLEKIVQVGHRVPIPDADSTERLIVGYAKRSGTVGLIDDSVMKILCERTGRNPRRIKRVLNSFVLEHHLDQRWSEHSLGSVALLTAVLLQHLYPTFYDWLVRDDAGQDPIGEFLDYADLRVRASDPPPRTDAWWSGATTTFRRYAIPPPKRSPADTGPLLDAVQQLETRLPREFARLAFDQAFIGLLTGAGDVEARRALRAQLVSRPLGSRVFTDEPSIDLGMPEFRSSS